MKTFAAVGIEITGMAHQLDNISLALLVDAAGGGSDDADRVACSTDLTRIAQGLRSLAHRCDQLSGRYDPAPGELVEIYGS